ncbi:MAG: hypothetical protein LN575_06325, partial [Rickettsia endosymbiont of Gnoriste bilineata]|nr:hypothetical protein [Rickettsia endosymbiont of Gnoriste bilineata]
MQSHHQLALPSVLKGHTTCKYYLPPPLKIYRPQIPITTAGEFDLPKQQEIAEKYRKIEEIKTNIK